MASSLHPPQSASLHLEANNQVPCQFAPQHYAPVVAAAVCGPVGGTFAQFAQFDSMLLYGDPRAHFVHNFDLSAGLQNIEQELKTRIKRQEARVTMRCKFRKQQIVTFCSGPSSILEQRHPMLESSIFNVNRCGNGLVCPCVEGHCIEPIKLEFALCGGSRVDGGNIITSPSVGLPRLPLLCYKKSEFEFGRAAFILFLRSALAIGWATSLSVHDFEAGERQDKANHCKHSGPKGLFTDALHRCRP